MAKLGSGKKQMQAVINKRNQKTKSFSKKIYKFLAALATYTALMFKYLFIALWWVIKQMFKLIYMLFVYIYRGIVFLVKKAAEKFRKKESEE
ncbi:MAG: hypothetical protein NC432_15570 [Roseburia sp.]|nr:hypothetical protein [Roseburia sp.]MCM1097690.1 hypothetical protein [Ruminococcus flavefaciens]